MGPLFRCWVSEPPLGVRACAGPVLEGEFIQNWNSPSRRIAVVVFSATPRSRPVARGRGCSTCGLCSCRTGGAWSLCFAVTADLLGSPAPSSPWPSPLLFPSARPSPSLGLARPLCFFFLQVSLISAGSSPSADPEPPSLMCFLAPLVDFFFSALAGINRGDDGHELTVPATREKGNSGWGGFGGHFVGHFVLNQSRQIKDWASCQKKFR